jgi:beta-carotene 3-hydroxylase
MRAYWLIVLLALAVALFMEVWAAVLHRVFWHGPLWSMHRSHHRKHHNRFEANDALSALHAPIAIALIVLGCGARDLTHDIMLGVGYGMTLFGASYLIVHDGFIHGRLPFAWLAHFAYFRRVRDAHNRHHREGRDVDPYGLFFSPFLRERNAPAKLL